MSVSFLAHVPYTDMGQPIEGLLVAGGIAFGELLGLTLEAQRAQVQVEVEREAQRGPASDSFTPSTWPSESLPAQARPEPHGEAIDVQHGPGRPARPVSTR